MSLDDFKIYVGELRVYVFVRVCVLCLKLIKGFLRVRGGLPRPLLATSRERASAARLPMSLSKSVFAASSQLCSSPSVGRLGLVAAATHDQVPFKPFINEGGRGVLPRWGEPPMWGACALVVFYDSKMRHPKPFRCSGTRRRDRDRASASADPRMRHQLPPKAK